jgi:uncharacterized lipoprotein YmbA
MTAESHTTWRLALVAAAASAALLQGCASNPPPRKLLVIPSAPQQADALNASTVATPSSARQSVAIAPIRLPESWQHRSVRYLNADAQVLAWPGVVWAERVESGMTRRLAQSLRQQEPTLGWWLGEDLMAPRRLLLDVQQLDVVPGRQQMVSMVSWRVIDRQARVLGWGTVSGSFEVAVDGPEAQAEALAKWLDVQASWLAPRVASLSDTADVPSSRH